MALSLDVIVVLESVSSQQLLYFLVWARCNFVDHRPREGNLRLVFQIVEEGSWYKSILYPALCIGEDASLYFITIVRTVIH